MSNYTNPSLFLNNNKNVHILTIFAGNIISFSYIKTNAKNKNKWIYAIVIDPANGLNNTHIPTAIQFVENIIANCLFHLPGCHGNYFLVTCWVFESSLIKIYYYHYYQSYPRVGIFVMLSFCFVVYKRVIVALGWWSKQRTKRIILCINPYDIPMRSNWKI